MLPILNQDENLTALLRAYNETKYVEGKAVEILYKAKKDLVTALVSITASLGLLSLTYLRLDVLDKGMVSTGYIIGVCGLLLYANWTGRLLLDIQRTNRDLKKLQEDQAVLLELIKNPTHRTRLGNKRLPTLCCLTPRQSILQRYQEKKYGF